MTYTTRFQYLLDKARDIAHAERLSNPSADDLPPLFFFTDPARTPHPEDIVAHLPEGCGIIYRHFGEGHALQRARLLRKIASDRGLILMIGEDHDLALEVEADGVHLRQHSLGRARDLHKNHPHLKLSAACHDLATLKSSDLADGPISAIFISPVFASNSPSAHNVEHIGIKNLRAMTAIAPLPVYGLGGISCDNVASLRDCGLSGIGAVDAFTLVD